MKALLNKSIISGTVRAPSSKSYTLRGLMCAALAQGRSELVYPLTSEDTEAALGVLAGLGIAVSKGESWHVDGGTFRAPARDLYCGDSATTLRFMAAICAAVPGKVVLTAGPSLAKRTVGPLIDALRQLGVVCYAANGLAPVLVQGGTFKGGVAELPGDISSQFASALLMAAPFAAEPVTVRLTTPLESKPYVLMTIECLAKFGVRVDHSPDLREFRVVPHTYQPANYVVEGDWSSASYLLALGAVAGDTTTENLNPDSLQGDKAMLGFLRDMHARTQVYRGAVTVRQQPPHAFHADLSDCPDLLPTVAAVAALAEGTSELTGIERARLKESDRVAAMAEGLERMGIQVAVESGRMLIAGGRPHGATIDSKKDHRIAMAFSIPGVATGDTIIENAECVAKTFPEYWEVLRSLGGEVNLI
jgi:3-phosphoshikimate 1-carboxyvinyltransferase